MLFRLQIGQLWFHAKSEEHKVLKCGIILLCIDATVWKFFKFPATQFLCEINFCESGVSKSAILIIIEVLKFSFCEFLHFILTEISTNFNLQPLELSKLQFLRVYICQSWFHVKYEWQKYFLVFTLCRLDVEITIKLAILMDYNLPKSNLIFKAVVQQVRGLLGLTSVRCNPTLPESFKKLIKSSKNLKQHLTTWLRLIK